MLLTLESNIYLAGRGALGQHETEISKTRVEKAAAEAEALKLQLEQCQIDAPFAGSVADSEYLSSTRCLPPENPF